MIFLNMENLYSNEIPTEALMQICDNLLALNVLFLEIIATCNFGKPIKTTLVWSLRYF